MLGAKIGMCQYAHPEPLAPLGPFVPIPKVDPPRRNASPRPQRERIHFALLVADGCIPITSAGRLARDVLRLWHGEGSLSRRTPCATHAEPRLVARGRRREERGRAARARRHRPRSAVHGVSGGCTRRCVMLVVARGAEAAAPSRVRHEASVKPLSSVRGAV